MKLLLVISQHKLCNLVKEQNHKCTSFMQFQFTSLTHVRHSQIRNAYFQGMNNHIILFYGESIPSTTTGSQAFTYTSWGLDASWWSEAGMLHNDVSCPQQHLLLCAYSKYCLVLAGSATSVFGSQGTNPSNLHSHKSHIADKGNTN